MVSNELLLKQLEEVQPDVINWRNWFHENAELSLKEKITSEKIVSVITQLGLEYEMVGDFGIIAKLVGGKNGKTVMLRADMDALPVNEDACNLKNAKKAVSKNEGVSHACGHDAHMAIVLGAMKVLCENKDDIKGTVLFVFEQAEEMGAGIFPMLKALKKYDISTCYGTHVYVGLPSGKISVQAGERMAAIASFTIKVIGRGGHASRPDLTINPLMCAAQIITNLNQIFTNEIDPTKTITLGIGMLQCGEKGNIIADEAVFAGTMRYYDPKEGKKAWEAIKRITEALGVAHRCEIEYVRVLQSDLAVVNDEECSKRAYEGIKSLLGEEVLQECPAWFATESMAGYLAEYPGVFAFLGVDDKENGFGSDHHTKEFDIDNNILINGVGASVKYILDSLDA